MVSSCVELLNASTRPAACMQTEQLTHRVPLTVVGNLLNVVPNISSAQHAGSCQDKNLMRLLPATQMGCASGDACVLSVHSYRQKGMGLH